MNVVFMGTPDFAVESLKALYEGGHCIKGVFTQPDKPRGRKKILTPPLVKVWALEHDIPVYQPESVRHGEADSILRELDPDVIVVAAYGNILPASLLNYPKYGCVNVHGSILPEYRGAAPIQWAVLDGKKKTGITTMQMDEGLDTGDILLIEEIEIGENETSGELFDRMAVLGGKVLLKTLDGLSKGNIIPKKQDNSKSSYASMLSKENSPIDWNNKAVEIHNQVRGLNPWPSATAIYEGKPIKIHETEIWAKPFSGKKFPGKLFSNKNELFVCCGDGVCLKIKSLQPHGSRRMDAMSFLNGHPIDEESFLS